MQGSTSLIFFLVAVASVAVRTFAVPPIYNVIDSGAVGDGIADDTEVFLSIWKKACADHRSPTILIPSGKNCLVGPVKLKGPCGSPIHFQIDGQLTAPSKIWLDKIDEFGHWIAFNHMNGLTIDGQGQINGSGRPWWQLKEKEVCTPTPDGLFIIHSSNVAITDLNFIDSPKKHITVDYTDNVYISNLTITAPGTSPNTDGIHIQSSQHINIIDTVIGTGDDCISIGNGTFDLNITRIICGPGHGISIGSLGKNNTDAIVGQIHVSDCDIHNTTNGLRIKTWPGRYSGYAKEITFERINFTSVERPIIIDQHYCDEKCNHCPTETTDLQVSKIRYSGLSGSAVGSAAITLNCSSTVGCLGIDMMDVNIQSVNGTTMETYCVNAKGTKSVRVSPPVRCM